MRGDKTYPGNPETPLCSSRDKRVVLGSLNVSVCISGDWSFPPATLVAVSWAMV